MKEITEITKKLKEKKKEIDTIKHEEEALLLRFHEHCPEGSDKYTEIRKFYEKITKKRRKVEKVDKEEAAEDDDRLDESGKITPTISDLSMNFSDLIVSSANLRASFFSYFVYFIS